LCGEFPCFSGGWREIVRGNCGFCVVVCGEFVVKTWWEDGVKFATKNTPTFEDLFLAG
jgi:hypothetical protein